MTPSQGERLEVEAQVRAQQHSLLLPAGHPPAHDVPELQLLLLRGVPGHAHLLAEEAL